MGNATKKIPKKEQFADCEVRTHASFDNGDLNRSLKPSPAEG
jgi:hypothetical protein